MSSNALPAELLAKLQTLQEEIAKSDDPDAMRRLIRTSLSTNPIMMADMYKASHASQLPADTTFILSFFEAREGAELPLIVNFGLQMILDEISAIRITSDHIDEAKEFFNATFSTKNIFNEEGWREIVANGGHIPVAIHALPEGMVVRPGVPLFTVENTNPKVPWIANWLETFLMHVWYPITVASLAFHQRQVLERKLSVEAVLPDSSIPDAAKLAFVDFGMRGVSSMTSAARAGAAVLTSFTSSDNALAGYELGKAYAENDYSKVLGSIPAAEHMTITIHGKDGMSNLEREKQAFLNMLSVYPTGPVSVVSDSYNYRDAVEKLWCGELVEIVKTRFRKAKVADPKSFHTLVIRPDSGPMIDNVLFTLDKIADAYGYTQTANGFKVVSQEVNVIQGDGIDLTTYSLLLDALHEHKWSVTNLVAGSGGGLLQKVNRDTLRCAIKASFVTVDGKNRGIQKETVGKKSKRGRLSVELEEDGEITVHEDGKGTPERNLLGLVFKDGKRLRTETLTDVRGRVDDAHVTQRRIHAASAVAHIPPIGIA